jgi:hypothetical protein
MRGEWDKDRRGMSGKWQAFWAMMIWIFGTVSILTVWPIKSRRVLSDVLGVIPWALRSIEDTWIAIVLVYAFIAVGLLMAGSAMYLAGEQLVKWYRRRKDGTINEYQIK